jgi:hypothetical protein
MTLFFREDEPQKLSAMNSKDRTASPGRKGLIPLRPNNPQETNNLVNNGVLANNRPVSEFHPRPGSMEDSGGNNASENKTTLKIHLVDGGFNVVKCSDTTDIKVSHKLLNYFLSSLVIFPTHECAVHLSSLH